MSRWMRSIKACAARVVSFARPLGSRENMLKGLSVLAVGAAAFFIGRMMGVDAAVADPVIPPRPGVESSNYGPGYSGRVVAYYYDKEAITREELAEFLIARFGAERLEFLVNKKIIDRACTSAGVIVTDIEVEAQFAKDLRDLGVGMSVEQFQKTILKPYNKTLYEWKEDVIRPKLQMVKFVQATCKIHVDPLEMQRGYEARYGEMVTCRMIVYRNDVDARKEWQQIALNPNRADAFLECAKKQYLPQLQATGGDVPPIHKHFGDLNIERTAFALKTNEVSQVIGMPDGTAIILLCQGRKPADPRPMEHPEIRDKLLKELSDLKLAQTVQSELLRLRRHANPTFLLGRRASMGQIDQEIRQEFGDAVNFRGIDLKK